MQIPWAVLLTIAIGLFSIGSLAGTTAIVITNMSKLDLIIYRLDRIEAKLEEHTQRLIRLEQYQGKYK